MTEVSPFDPSQFAGKGRSLGAPAEWLPSRPKSEEFSRHFHEAANHHERSQVFSPRSEEDRARRSRQAPPEESAAQRQDSQRHENVKPDRENFGEKRSQTSPSERPDQARHDKEFEPEARDKIEEKQARAPSSTLEKDEPAYQEVAQTPEGGEGGNHGAAVPLSDEDGQTSVAADEPSPAPAPDPAPPTNQPLIVAAAVPQADGEALSSAAHSLLGSDKSAPPSSAPLSPQPTSLETQAGSAKGPLAGLQASAGQVAAKPSPDASPQEGSSPLPAQAKLNLPTPPQALQNGETEVTAAKPFASGERQDGGSASSSPVIKSQVQPQPPQGQAQTLASSVLPTEGKKPSPGVSPVDASKVSPEPEGGTTLSKPVTETAGTAVKPEPQAAQESPKPAPTPATASGLAADEAKLGKLSNPNALSGLTQEAKPDGVVPGIGALGKAGGGEVAKTYGQLQEARSALLSSTKLTATDLAFTIKRISDRGLDAFQIRIDPPELGKVDVRLEWLADGQTRAHLTADRQETLDLLTRDARELQRSLEQAGVKVSDQGLKFSLNQEGRGDSQGAQGEQEGHQNSAKESEPQPETEPEAPVHYLHREGGLDIHV